MTITRNYGYKDVDMLIASKTVAENFESRKPEIVAVRPTWADPFIETFKTRIDNGISSILGLNPRDDLKAATRVVTELQTKALKDLSFFKVQIEADFATDKKYLSQLLDKLGFNKVYALAQKKDQQALTQVLARFRQNMSAELETELTTKGLSPDLIGRIQGYADTLTAANVTQESLKGSTKTITAAGIAELNEIYAQAMAICKICSRQFSGDPIAKKMFSFSALVSALGTQKPSTTSTEQAETSTVGQTN